MRLSVIVGCNLAFIFVDIVVTTVLYVQGSSLEVFEDDVKNFDVRHSLLDLWGTLLLRVCLLLGASIGVLWNRRDGPRRVARLRLLATFTSLVVLSYALVKLLVLSEQGALAREPWFLALLAWTCGAAVTAPLLWRLLARARGDEVAGEESERLVDGEREGEAGREEEEPKEKCQTAGKGARRQPNSGATVGRLLSYCKQDSALLTTAFFFLLLSAVCEAFIPYYTGKAIDGIVMHKSMEYFAKPMIILTVLALVSSVAIGVRGGVFALTFARLSIRLRNLLFRSLVHQEIAFFDTNHTGDITSRLTSDTTQVSDLISQNVNLFLRSFIKGAGYFIFMFGMSWKLSLVIIMGFPYIAVISQLYGEHYKKLTKEVQASLAHANRVAEETISAMRTVRSFACEEQEADGYHRRLLDVFRLNKKQALAYACFMWSSCISELALQVAILFYGGHLVVTGQITGGTLISFIIYELELGECLESIASVYTGLMQGVGAAEKVFEYIDRKPRHAPDGLEAPDTLRGLVEFHDVTFAYPTRPDTDVLKSVSFSIHPGEVTALVGPSGSGKSSCVCLLENFYSPMQGQVLLDGRPVQSYQHDYLHSKVALVSQEPVLFARSVQKNISYGLTDAPMEAVVAAATKANAHEFICGLSKGYDTGVGEKGSQLSGGQKQRVAIARALIRQPCVLVLDEATSALDAESEHVVQQALNGAMENCTVLVIAHRLSTVERADRIVVLQRGSVAEQGRHAELLARRGIYYRLVQRQALRLEGGATDEVPRPPGAPPPQSREEDEEFSEGEGGEAGHRATY
ncbi:ATP-binding cassette sub-family B member 9 [Electrophorus electricus]|uniref:ABC-type oligopeptide transporter ABCB9 n=1 Tax=Electrophorus electricus TaxID=8005 RepID=A0A4W4FYQ3_ELEEL|nr:ATP-binding cassette sub-family B member 9 [Electrophorus electricus]